MIMTEYQVHSRSEDNAIQATWTMRCRDDDECREMANAILASGPMTIIEIWNDVHMLFRLVRPSDPVELKRKAIWGKPPQK
jgi:hypothetical protein